MYGRALVAILLVLLLVGGVYPVLADIGEVSDEDLPCLVALVWTFGVDLEEAKNGLDLATSGLTNEEPKPTPVLSFEPNYGQTDKSYSWLSQGAGFFLFLNPSGATLDMRDGRGRNTGVLRAAFDGASPNAMAEPLQYRHQQHYLLGDDPAAWRTNVPVFGSVKFAEVYPGIDITYYQGGEMLEYDWTIRAGADPARIRMRFPEADEIRLDGKGNLLLRVGKAATIFHAPRTYEQRTRKPIASAWRFLGDGSIGFQLAGYDRRETLVIDPAIQFLSYVGRGGADFSGRAATDSQGNLYFAGSTINGEWPVTPGAALANRNGNFPSNAYVTKMSADGTQVLFSTVYGGAQGEIATGIAIDGQGNILLTGSTRSDNFPVTANAIQAKSPSLAAPDPFSTNCYVTKLNASGSAAVFSTYLGGEKLDACTAIASDRQGNIYIAGATNSATLTVTPDVVQSRFRPASEALGHDLMVVKLSPTGERMYSTYLGGSGHEFPLGLAVDAAGAAFVTGYTTSGNFPVTQGAFRTANAGRGGAVLPFLATGDAFVLKLSPDATAISYATFLGGARDDVGTSIALDAQGNAYVTGTTLSTDFPTTAQAAQRTWRGLGGENNLPAGDAFVAKLNPSGSQLVYSTLLGGTLDDRAMAIAVDGQGSAWVAGHTHSKDFPVTPDATQAQNRSLASSPGQVRFGNAFVANLTAAGDRINFATYMGGTGHDVITGLVLTPDGSPMVVGMTSSQNLATTAGTYQPRYFGAPTRNAPFEDLFVARFGATSTISVAAVVNAASYAQNAVTPGMIVTLAGTGIGPAQLTGGSVVNNRFSTNIGQTQILFDGTPAPIIYVSGGQSSVVVPYNVAGKQTVQVTVERGGARSAPLPVNVVAAAPGLFSANSSGQGPGAILNQDSSVNTAQNPAEPQSIVILYGTGEGAVRNTPQDGALVGAPYPAPTLPVRVTVGGREAEVLYAGAAPGLVAGLFQVNIKLPPNLPAGNQPVVVAVGTANSQSGLTVAVK